MMRRAALLEQANGLLRHYPVVALLGARQVGKTTLSLQIARERPSLYLDLESDHDRARLTDAETYLSRQSDRLVILDEVQREPRLFPLLRSLVDRRRQTGEAGGQFLLLGSAAPELVHGISESLAGRLATLELPPFQPDEVGGPLATVEQLWLRGGFPNSFLAADDAVSFHWRGQFVSTFLERDLPSLGLRLPAETLRRFWTMLAHGQGAVWNGSRLAAGLGLSVPTLRRHLDLLTGCFLVRQLAPHQSNLGKRMVKAPKVYVRDSGLLHRLANIVDVHTLLGHPLCGPSWEGFAIESLINRCGDGWRSSFYRSHAGAELDLLVHLRGRRYGFEIKYADAPGASRSMHVALHDLGLEHLWIIYPGKQEYALDARITVLPMDALSGLAATLR